MPHAASSDAWWCPLAEFGLLVFEGADAAAFLQGQLSSDVAALAPGQGQWTSYNSPKGRVLANAWLWRSVAPSDRFCALVAADVAAATAKRLAMFVLRAKLRVEDATAARRLFGVGGRDARSAVTAALGAAPPAREALAAHAPVADVVGLPDGRFVVVTSAEAGAAATAALAAHAAGAQTSRWRAADIATAVPWVTRATSDAFVLQMLNLDALGGVSFQKGCYPGQEVVARTRYLGRLKERLFALHADAPAPAAGTRVFSPAFPGQPCGTVVNATAADDGGTDLLAVVQLAAAEAAGLALAAPDGPPLAVRALPYPLPEAAPPRGRLG